MICIKNGFFNRENFSGNFLFFRVWYSKKNYFLFILMKRILLKISGEMLSTDGFSVQSKALENVYQELKEGYESGKQIGIVLGGGNFWRGRDNENLQLFRGKSDQVGMLATVMNALVFSAYLEKKGVKTAVFSSRSMPSFCQEFSFNQAEKAFEEGRICFFCGGTGNPYFTTDSASALKAIETKCDMYAKATTVDGVYDSDPRKNPHAKKYIEVSFDEVIQKNLQVMDTAAFALCRENNLPIRVFDGATKGNIAAIISGEKIGTFIS
jgi:uridylate kinase